MTQSFSLLSLQSDRKRDRKRDRATRSDSLTVARDNYVTWQSRKTKSFHIFSAETRQQKRPLWKGDDTLCADGRSCEFFLMCWMTAGLLDGSCGGIMFACCQRKENPKALTDYNLIESPRDQSRPLPLDLYTETDSDDRKSFLRKSMPSMHWHHALASMNSSFPLSGSSLFFSLSSSFYQLFVIFLLKLNYFAIPRTCMYSKHVISFLKPVSSSKNCIVSSLDIFYTFIILKMINVISSFNFHNSSLHMYIFCYFTFLNFLDIYTIYKHVK